MNVLAVDIGGTHIKLRTQRKSVPVKIKSGLTMTPARMMKAIAEETSGWKFDRISLGYPGPVVHNRPLLEPHNLGRGWVNFKFDQAFEDKPVRMVNDAVMQALGSYKGGRMLFLGLGTGLGSAMVVEGVAQPMELAHLPWKNGRTYEEYLGEVALRKHGLKKWLKNLRTIMDDLKEAMECEYIVLGGGNAKLVPDLPKHVLRGDNDNAFKGGFLLWSKDHVRSR